LLIFATTAPLLWHIAGNFSDKFYHKFQYSASSMILGGSRALFGLDPECINKTNWINGPLLNFSFTIATSPYGEIYYNAILKKLSGNNKQGIFILEVNPVGISTKKLSNKLPETELVLGRLKVFNMNRNVDYILENSGHPLYQFLMNKKAGEDDGEIPHASGWLESLGKFDSAKSKQNISKGVISYTKVFSESVVSEDRLFWLEKIIEKLSENGHVFLIRMPISPEMKQMEDAYCPDFNNLMQQRASSYKADFLDFSGETNYTFKDVHHMTTESAEKFSVFLGDTLVKVHHN